MNILFVDDNPIKIDVSVKAIKKELEPLYKDELHIYTAKNYMEAVEAFNENEVNIVVTDRMMPGIDKRGLGGDDLVRYIRNDIGSSIPIIIISGKSDEKVWDERMNYERDGIQYIMRAEGSESDAMEVAVKIRGICYTQNIESNSNEIIYRDMILDNISGILKYKDSKSASLTDKQALLLGILLKKALKGTALDRLATYEELSNAIYPGEWSDIALRESIKDRLKQLVKTTRGVMQKAEIKKIEIKAMSKRGYFING